MRAAVLTVSDRVSAGVYEDRGGDILASLLAEDGFDVERRVVADELKEIEGAIVELSLVTTLIVTTGGTGVAPRDITPDATELVIDRLIPGIAQAIRADAIAKTPHGLLSRGVAGVRGRTLIVNLPGSPGGCKDGYAVLRPALHHALELISDEPTEHHQT